MELDVKALAREIFNLEWGIFDLPEEIRKKIWNDDELYVGVFSELIRIFVHGPGRALVDKRYKEHVEFDKSLGARLTPDYEEFVIDEAIHQAGKKMGWIKMAFGFGPVGRYMIAVFEAQTEWGSSFQPFCIDVEELKIVPRRFCLEVAKRAKKEAPEIFFFAPQMAPEIIDPAVKDKIVEEAIWKIRDLVELERGDPSKVTEDDVKRILEARNGEVVHVAGVEFIWDGPRLIVRKAGCEGCGVYAHDLSWHRDFYKHPDEY